MTRIKPKRIPVAGTGAATIDDFEDRHPEPLPQTGAAVQGQGLFICAWEPARPGDGRKLGQVFAVFAAPEDVREKGGGRLQSHFPALVKTLAALKKWHGHDGGRYDSEEALYAALRDGTYGGTWVVPPLDVLRAVFNSKGTGGLKGTFADDVSARQGVFHQGSVFYWSCTENPDGFMAVDFVSGEEIGALMDYHTLNCRPVRFVPIRRPRGLSA